METNTTYTVGDSTFVLKENAELLEKINAANAELQKAKGVLDALQKSCEHTELSYPGRTATSSDSISDGAGGSCAANVVVYTVHNCKVCGRQVSVMPDGSRRIGW